NFVLTNAALMRSDGVTFHLNGITQARLSGGAHDNTFDVSAFTGQATLDGAAGGADSVVSSNNANFTLTDTSLTRSTGGSFALGNDSVQANGGNDTVDAGAGNDTVLGGAGDDSIIGGTGADLLVGQAGNDKLFANSIDNVANDNVVNFLWGDFGTNGNEAGSGN